MRQQAVDAAGGNRYGPRGPYKKRDFTADIEAIFENESDRYFKSWLRMPRTSFDRVLHLIKNDDVFKSTGRKRQIEIHIQLAAYLIRYGYTTGTKTSSKAKVSEGSVYKCYDEKREIKLMYQEDGFPGAIGAVDGTYFQLLDKPKFRPMAYLCRKKFWAVNALIVVGPDERILFYDLGWPGSVADVTIWKRCHLWLNRDRYLAPDEWLFGDKGYTLTKYMIIPFEEYEIHDAEPQMKRTMKKWNKSMSSQRIVVEHTFGRLKARFAYLQGIRGRHMRTIYRVIESLFILHNVLLDFGDFAEDLGAAEAAEVMQARAEAQLNARHRMQLPADDGDNLDATLGIDPLRIGRERRRQLVEYWVGHV
ncbi:DDE superfamily endonuclease [Ceratobasidium sp. AG-Ba]|nr:DDE superfamily endonuclease [Ceratobasidium sp. AG-Ba]